MKTTTKFILGESIYIDDKFVGHYVENLTDNLPGEDINFRKNLKKQGYIGTHLWNTSYGTFSKYYSRRKVWSQRFGTKEQILVDNIDSTDLVWINL